MRRALDTPWQVMTSCSDWQPLPHCFTPLWVPSWVFDIFALHSQGFCQRALEPKGTPILGSHMGSQGTLRSMLQVGPDMRECSQFPFESFPEAAAALVMRSI